MKLDCYHLLYQFLKDKWSAKNSNSITPFHQNANSYDEEQPGCSVAGFRIHGRALHYAFKIGERTQTLRFYREILGMKVLRHDEFTHNSEGNNEPFDNRWSRTMVGYGPEDEYFAFELTYNYPIHNYLKGNEFVCVTIRSRDAISRAKQHNWPILDDNILEAPGGFRFRILDEPEPIKDDPIVKITLSCSNYKQSLDYWHATLGMTLFERDTKRKSFSVGFRPNQTKLEFQQIEQPILFGEQVGRICFSCPHYQQPEIANRISNKGYRIIVPLVSLETLGKPTIRMVILSDPNGHEVCFFDDLAFRQLSQYSPEDEERLNEYIAREEERDNCIGDPAKKAEYRQIEDSMKKNNGFFHKMEIKKDVSLTVQPSMIKSNDTDLSIEKIETLSTLDLEDDEETTSNISAHKMIVIVTRNNEKNSKSRNISKHLLRSEIGLKNSEQIIQKNNRNEALNQTSNILFKTTKDNSNHIMSVYPNNSIKRIVSPRFSKDNSSLGDIKTSSKNSEQLQEILRKAVSDRINETISFTVAQTVEAAITKVVSEKLNATVQKAVSEKIVESVAKAVAQLEESVKKVVSHNLPLIHEDIDICSISLRGNMDEELLPNRQKRSFKVLNRRPSKALEPLKESSLLENGVCAVKTMD